jgi:holo-[acyl-carrier protein] synthase
LVKAFGLPADIKVESASGFDVEADVRPIGAAAEDRGTHWAIGGWSKSLCGGEWELMSTGTAIRVGADVVSVHQVAESVENFGQRYLGRVYTDHELGSCRGVLAVRAAGLAARFAAKEAMIKVLRPTGHQPDWRSMEVQRHSGGWCTMALSGHAAVLAEQAGIDELSMSLTHEGDIAAAVVVALCRRDTDSVEQSGPVPDPASSERDD